MLDFSDLMWCESWACTTQINIIISCSYGALFKRSFPYSQFARIKRICGDQEASRVKTWELRKNLECAFTQKNILKTTSMVLWFARKKLTDLRENWKGKQPLNPEQDEAPQPKEITCTRQGRTVPSTGILSSLLILDLLPPTEPETPPSLLSHTQEKEKRKQKFLQGSYYIYFSFISSKLL